MKRILAWVKKHFWDAGFNEGLRRGRAAQTTAYFLEAEVWDDAQELGEYLRERGEDRRCACWPPCEYAYLRQRRRYLKRLQYLEREHEPAQQSDTHCV